MAGDRPSAERVGSEAREAERGPERAPRFRRCHDAAVVPRVFRGGVERADEAERVADGLGGRGGRCRHARRVGTVQVLTICREMSDLEAWGA